MVPENDHQASLQLPAATRLPGQPLWQASAYLRSAALRVRTRLQRSDGTVVLISSMYCVSEPYHQGVKMHFAHAACGPLRVRAHSQLSDGAVVLIRSIFCFLSLSIKASRCTLRLQHVGIARPRAFAAQRRRSGAYMFNVLRF